LRKRSTEFDLVDDVAHAFKHVFVGNAKEPRLKSGDVISRPGAFQIGAIQPSAFQVGGVTLDQNRGVDLLKTIRKAVE